MLAKRGQARLRLFIGRSVRPYALLKTRPALLLRPDYASVLPSVKRMPGCPVAFIARVLLSAKTGATDKTLNRLLQSDFSGFCRIG